MKLRVRERFYRATLPLSKRLVQRCTTVEVSDEEGKLALENGLFYQVPDDAAVQQSRLLALKKVIESRQPEEVVPVDDKASKDAANLKRSEAMKRRHALKQAEKLGITVSDEMTLDQIKKLIEEKGSALESLKTQEEQEKTIEASDEAGSGS